MTDIAGWFSERLPDGWFEGYPEVTIDRDEIVVVGTLPDVEAGPEELDTARAGRAKRFREDTRAERMAIAGEAQKRFRRKVSWGVRIGGTERLFTHLSIPVMTRLRMAERHVLDTLIESGVARSRSEALAWCVALVGKNEAEWIGELRDALVRVREVRAGGPNVA